jgi:hypothetical protein
MNSSRDDFIKSHHLLKFRASNNDVNDYMNSIGISGDYQGLEGVYIDRTIAMVNNDLGKKAMVWQEVFDNGGAEMDAETIVHIWKVDMDYYQELAKASTTSTWSLHT